MAPSSPLAPVAELPNAASHVGSPKMPKANTTSSGDGKNDSSNDELASGAQRHEQSTSQAPTSASITTSHRLPKENRRSESNTTPSAPTLVNPGPTASPDMKHKKPSLDPPPPDPSSFTFPSLLSSIGPEADDSITAIAEICGKSNMSLADEHGSHLPPLGDAIVYIQREGGGTIESRINGGKLGKETEEESRDGVLARVVKWFRGEGSAQKRKEKQGRGGEVKVLRVLEREGQGAGAATGTGTGNAATTGAAG